MKKVFFSFFVLFVFTSANILAQSITMGGIFPTVDHSGSINQKVDYGLYYFAALPLFNFNGEEVITHTALASYGVSHKQVGANAAIIIDKLLNGEKAGNIKPTYPTEEDHKAFISKRRSNQMGLKIPTDMQNITIVE